MKGTAAALAFFCAAIGAAAAEPSNATNWTQGFNNKSRVIAGEASGGPVKGAHALFAALEISMPAGWKTYWRNPGEAGGVPPEFDFSGSENLQSATVLYPAPHRLIDPKAGVNIGYKEHVIFPIAVVPKTPGAPIGLKIKAAYGVCKDICVPAEAEFSIDIVPDAPPSEQIATALSAVPAALAVNTAAPDSPRVTRWQVDAADAKAPKLKFEVDDPSAESGDAFLFSPDGLYLPLPEKLSASGGKAVYQADLSDGVDLKDIKGKQIGITVTGLKGQSETIIQIP